MSPSSFLKFLLLAAAAASLIGSAKSDGADVEDKLLQGINGYRTALNLSALTENDNAECLADEISDRFENQPCTNTSGANAVIGSSGPIPDYTAILAKCHLDVTVVKDAAILPACVPGLDPAVLLANYTKSQYNEQLNDSRYVGAGVGSEGNWVVVVLSTATPQGSLAPVHGSSAAAGVVPHALVMLVLMLLMMLT